MRVKTARVREGVIPPGQKVRETYLTDERWDMDRDARRGVLWIWPRGQSTPVMWVELHNVIETSPDEEALAREQAASKGADASGNAQAKPSAQAQQHSKK